MYDVRMIKDFLVQLSRELVIQLAELEARPVPPGIRSGVDQLHSSRGGKTLFPPPNATARREQLAGVRKEVLLRAMGMIEVIEGLGLLGTGGQAE
ncbi:MAG: hypothetical protein C0501_30955 [Isosphaera sp.]|nr:hypothetical protein [Isosphaera sp.]